MKKVINASIGGRSFALDEDAYNRLSVYFDHFKSRLNRDTQSARDEVMSDLESRIAELFDEGIGGASYRVVDLALVSKVVGQLGMPDGSPVPGGAGDTGAACAKSAAAVPHKLFRDPQNARVAGCSGLASFLNIDTTIVRIILLLALLLWGTGLLVYLVLWIVVPLAKTPAQKCEMRGLEPTAENMAKFNEYRK